MAKKTLVKEKKRVYRHKRLRKKIVGTSVQPRLAVHRSLKNFSAQVVDDSIGKVLFGMSTLDKGLRSQNNNGGNINAAAALGESFATEAQKAGVKKVCFDRGGYKYHGRVKAFAEAARNGGLEF